LSILAALKDDPRISTWDMDEGRPRLWRTIEVMIKEGLIVNVDEPYPYCRYALTDKGKAMIEEAG